jgi:hypothetical protein
MQDLHCELRESFWCHGSFINETYQIGNDTYQFGPSTSMGPNRISEPEEALIELSAFRAEITVPNRARTRRNRQVSTPARAAAVSSPASLSGTPRDRTIEVSASVDLVPHGVIAPKPDEARCRRL